MSIIYPSKSYLVNDDIIDKSEYIKYLLTECDENKEIHLNMYQETFEIIYFNKYDIVEELYEKRDIKSLEHINDGFKYFQSNPSNFFEKIKNEYKRKTQEQLIPFFEKHILGVNMTSLCLNKIIPFTFFEKHIEYLEKNDWDILCENEIIPVEFFEKHIDKININSLCKNKNIPVEFFDKYIKNISKEGLHNLGLNYNLPIEFFEKYIENFENISSLLTNPSLPIEFIKKHINRFPRVSNKIELICLNTNYPVEFFEQFSSDIDILKIEYLCENKNIPVSFLEKYIDKLSLTCWYNLCKNEYIPIEFFEKYIHKIYWTGLLKNKRIPTSFFEKHYDNRFEKQLIFDTYIEDLCNRNFSVKFMEKHNKLFRVDKLCSNIHLSPKFFEKNIKSISNYGAILLSQNPNISLEFWENHIGKFCYESLCKNETIPFKFIEEKFNRYTMKSKYAYITCLSNISLRKDVSLEFIQKHFRYIDWENLCKNKNFSLSFFEKYIYKINWISLSKKDTVKEELDFVRTLSFYKDVIEIEIIE